jgi:copper(I)-binding protein
LTNYSNYINGLYIVLYGRTADSGGYNYWLNTQGVSPAAAAVTPISAASEQALSKAFVSTQSSYFDATYGLTSSSGAALSDTNFILALYNNLGGNDTGVSGAALTYWQNALNAVNGDRAALAGRFTEEFLSYNGADPAGLLRQASFFNSVAVSQAWVSASASNSFMDAATTTDPAFLAQQHILTGITSDPATLATALGQITTAVSSQSLTGVVGQGGATVTLTTGPDHITLLGNNSVVVGFVDTTPGSTDSTLNPFDSINGGTTTGGQVSVSYAGLGGGAPDATMGALISNISAFAIRNTVLATTVALDASVIPGLKSVVSNLGVGDVFVNNLAAGGSVSVVGNGSLVNGNTTATYVAGATAATLKLIGGTNYTAGAVGAVTLLGPGLTSAAVTSTGAANIISQLILPATVTSLDVNATTNFTSTFGINDNALKTITVEGSAGSVNLGATSSVVAISVDAHNLTAGGVTVDLSAAVGVSNKFIGGAGSNVLTIDETALVKSGTSLDGGASITGAASELTVNNLGVATAADYTALKATTHFTTLGLVDFANTINAGTGGLAGTFHHFSLTSFGADTITGLSSGDIVDVLNNSVIGDTFNPQTPGGTLNLNIGSSATAANLTLSNLEVNGFTSVALASNGDGAHVNTIFSLNGTSGVTFNVTGSEDLTIGAVGTTAAGGITFDAHALTGALNFTDSGKADIILTGSGKSTITGTGAGDTITFLAGHTAVDNLVSFATALTQDTVTGFSLNKDVLGHTGGALHQATSINLGTVTNGSGIIASGAYASFADFNTAVHTVSGGAGIAGAAAAWSDGTNTYVAEWTAANTAHIVELVNVTGATSVTTAAGAGHLLIA